MCVLLFLNDCQRGPTRNGLLGVIAGLFEVLRVVGFITAFVPIVLVALWQSPPTALIWRLWTACWGVVFIGSASISCA